MYLFIWNCHHSLMAFCGNRSCIRLDLNRCVCYYNHFIFYASWYSGLPFHLCWCVAICYNCNRHEHGLWHPILCIADRKLRSRSICKRRLFLLPLDQMESPNYILCIDRIVFYFFRRILGSCYFPFNAYSAVLKWGIMSILR